MTAIAMPTLFEGDNVTIHGEVGDVVSVTGDIDYGFIDGRELVASSITTINDRRS